LVGGVLEVLACDLKLESAAQITVKEGIAYCELVGLCATRPAADDSEDTEEHIDFLETQTSSVR
jgi:bacterioferritin